MKRRIIIIIPIIAAFSALIGIAFSFAVYGIMLNAVGADGDKMNNEFKMAENAYSGEELTLENLSAESEARQNVSKTEEKQEFDFGAVVALTLVSFVLLFAAAILVQRFRRIGKERREDEKTRELEEDHIPKP